MRLRWERSLELLPALIASLFVVGFTLAFGTRESMWTDEAFSAETAGLSFGHLVDRLVQDEPNMAPYYLGLWSWSRIDSGDLWLRSFSAVGTIVAIWGIWLVARRWSGTLAAALAVTVFTLSPFVLGWSIQARGYTWAMAGIAWSTLLADRLLDRPSRGRAILLGVVAGLTVAVQFAAAFPMVGVLLALGVLSALRRTLSGAVLAALVAFLVFIPFGLVGLNHPRHLSWMPEFSTWLVRKQFGTLVNGPLWILLVLAGLGSAILGLRRGTVPPRVWLAVAGTFVGFFGLLAESAAYQSMFLARYLSPGLPLAIVAAATGWTWLAGRDATIRAGVAAIVGGVAVLTLVVAFDNTRIANPQGNREAAARVEAAWAPGDAILPNRPWVVTALLHYLPAAPVDGAVVDARASNVTPGGSLVSTDGRPIDPDRLWVVGLALPADTATARAKFDAILGRYPAVVSSESFGSVALQLRTR